jgi:hypothetical protein
MRPIWRAIKTILSEKHRILVTAVIPIAVSLRKAFTRNRKIQIAVLSILGGLLGPLFWVVAMSLAFSKVNEEPREETV